MSSALSGAEGGFLLVKKLFGLTIGLLGLLFALFGKLEFLLLFGDGLAGGGNLLRFHLLGALVLSKLLLVFSDALLLISGNLGLPGGDLLHVGLLLFVELDAGILSCLLCRFLHG